MREVFFLIGRGESVLYSDASESPSALPDTRARWEAIWARRGELVEIAHSHPIGPHAFSQEDRTTMAALDAALGRRLRFSVVSPSGVVVRDAEGNETTTARDPAEPAWVGELRRRSGIKE